MALTINTCEGGTLTDTVSVANSGGASGTAWSNVVLGSGTIVYSSDAYYHGKVAILNTPAPATANYVERAIGGSRSGAGAMNIKFNSLPTTGQSFIRILSGGAANIVSLGLTNLGLLFTSDGAGASGTSVGTIVTGVWYRLEFWWTNPTTSTGTFSFRVYRGDNTVAEISHDQTTMNNTTNTSGLLRIGKISGSGNFGAFCIDNIAYDDGTTTPPTLSIPSPDVYYVAERGSESNTTTATTTVVDLPAGAAITTGNYLIARIALDNAGTSGATPTISSITDNASNVWTSTAVGLSDPGAASEGVATYIAYAKVTNAYANGNDVTFTWGVTVPAKSIVIEEWANINAVTPVAVTATTANGTASTAVATGSITPLATGQLVYVAIGIESPAGEPFALDSDTTDGSWLALKSKSTNTATATDNVTLRGGVKRVTGVGAQQFNVTLATARDWSAVALIFDPPTPSVPLDTPSGVTVTPSLTLRSATCSWTAVANADSYLVEFEVLDVAGDPLDEADWSPLAPENEFTTAGLGVTIDDTDGLEWGRSYRARVTAIAPV